MRQLIIGNRIISDDSNAYVIDDPARFHPVIANEQQIASFTQADAGARMLRLALLVRAPH